MLSTVTLWFDFVLLSRTPKLIFFFCDFTCCLSAAVVIFGKTFTVTEQEDAESSTTTVKLLNTKWNGIKFRSVNISGCTGLEKKLPSTIRHTRCSLNPLPDFSVLVVCRSGLNLQLNELSGERSGNDGGRLHVPRFYGLRQLRARLL